MNQSSVLDSKVNKAKAQILPQAYPSIICDTFNCNSRAKYRIGINGGPPNKVHNLCEACAQNVVVSGLESGVVEIDGATELTNAKSQLHDIQRDLDQALTERNIAREELLSLNGRLAALLPPTEQEEAPAAVTEEEKAVLLAPEAPDQLPDLTDCAYETAGHCYLNLGNPPVMLSTPEHCTVEGCSDYSDKVDGDEDTEIAGDEEAAVPEEPELTAGTMEADALTIDYAAQSYTELQEAAKERGLKYVGVSKDDLIDSLKEGEDNDPGF